MEYINKILHGDCLEIMKNIPDNTIDCVMCDLPYGTTDAYWDTVIPMDLLWKEYDRICKPSANVILFGSEPFSTKLRMSRFDLFKYDLIWIKNKVCGHVHAKNMPMKDYENVSVFSYGSIGHESLLAEKRMTYNPQGLVKSGRVYHNALRKFGGLYGDRPSHKEYHVSEYTNYPTMTLYFDSDGNEYHPTQKPIDLLRYLLLTYTNENDLVLDNTCGSGSTLVACIKEKRRFVGIEKDEKYFNIAVKRVNQEFSQPTLF